MIKNTLCFGVGHRVMSFQIEDGVFERKKLLLVAPANNETSETETTNTIKIRYNEQVPKKGRYNSRHPAWLSNWLAFDGEGQTFSFFAHELRRIPSRRKIGSEN